MSTATDTKKAPMVEIIDRDQRAEDMGQQVLELAAKGQGVKIVDDKSLADAAALLKAIRDYRKEKEAYYEQKKKPLREYVNNLIAECKALLEPLVQADKMLDHAITFWHQKQRAIAAEKQAKENEKHEQRIAKAIDKGKDVDLVAPPKVIEAPPTVTHFEGGGSTGVQKVWRWFLAADKNVRSDMEKKPDIYANDPRVQGIPAEFFVLDYTKINAAVRFHKKADAVPGVTAFEDLTTRTR